jgi:hypothetical protein
MNRRGFLQLLGAATAVSAGGIALIDTAKTFFLPPVGGWRLSEMALSLNEFEERFIQPAAQAIARQFDEELWVFGETSTELWYKPKDTRFPFAMANRLIDQWTA